MKNAYPNEVESSCDHDYTRGPFLPDHPPKVPNGRFGRSLGNYVGLWLNQALQKRTKNTVYTFGK